jgi:hypothetical protein
MENENIQDEHVWIVLQEIKNAYSKANYSEYVQFDYHKISDPYRIPEEDIRNILERLINQQVIKSKSMQWTMIEVCDSKFNEFYEIYQVKFDKKRITTNYLVDIHAEWQDDFVWQDKNFIVGDYGSVDLKSPIRLKLFSMLTEAKGNWVKVQDMRAETGKDASFIRSTLGQIEKQFKPDLRKHLSIPSTKEDNLGNKPSQGAYRLKFKSNLNT